MRALFKVSFQERTLEGLTFCTKNVIATSAGEAVREAEKDVKDHQTLVASAVEMLGVVTVDD